MPSAPRESDELTATTGAGTINIYRVGNLNQACSGEVTAIEYCYQYDVSGGGEVVFNWTVLILEDAGANSFRITDLHVVESRPDSSSSVSCDTRANGGRRKCCDVEQIIGFGILPVSFVFGVIGSSQGNTRSATLLGFHHTLTQYQVDTILLSSAGLTLSVGSTLPSVPVVARGLHMLWFVIGKPMHGRRMYTTLDIHTPHYYDFTPANHGLTFLIVLSVGGSRFCS